MALFARLDENRRLQLVNHLGVKLGEDTEQMLSRLERGEFDAADIEHDPNRRDADHDYARRVRAIDSSSPARLMRTPSAYSRPPAVRAKSCCLPCGWIPFPKTARRKLRTFLLPRLSSRLRCTQRMRYLGSGVPFVEVAR